MKRLITSMRSFRDDERGSIALETVIIIPVLFWAYLAMFAIFDSYRQNSVNQKAAYTLGDIISRETTPLDADYVYGAREVLAYLTGNPESDVSVRITSVKYDAENDVYERDWSRAQGSHPALTESQVALLAPALPTMPDNEHVMIVETFVDYNPPFSVGLNDREIKNFVFTRPRYAPRVLYAEGT
ncbi:MAG: TadE/TadG family type IV pilus assembly protein [Pseudomonadota bacterium]